jgi:hypothetical protein
MQYLLSEVRRMAATKIGSLIIDFVSNIVIIKGIKFHKVYVYTYDKINK